MPVIRRCWKLVWKRGLPMLYLALVAFFALFPFYWMVSTSFKPSDEVFANPPRLLPQRVYLDAYRELLFDPRSEFPRYMLNSLIVAGSTACLSCLCAALGAYAFSKFRFPGNKSLSFFLFLTQLFPQAVILVPLFIVFKSLKLYDTYGALILANMVFAVPVSIWLMIGFYDSIPSELMDAGLIDGCTRLGVLFRILAPIARNGIVATMMYIFISTWSELLFAVTFTTSRAVRTLPLALSNFIGQYTTDWAGLLAASTLTAVPVAVIFLLLQRYFIAGMTSGAMKG